jgi:hypothetical protein
MAKPKPTSLEDLGWEPKPRSDTARKQKAYRERVKARERARIDELFRLASRVRELEDKLGVDGDG